MLWPVAKRTRYSAIRERMTSEEGKRMRCIRGAKAAHAKIRSQGRVPGEEGRKAIAWDRETRKRDREKGKCWRIGNTHQNDSAL